MKCEYFGKCASCTMYKLSYEEQILQKQIYARDLFNIKNLSFFALSPTKHYRSRAEFGIYHKGDELHYTMFDKDKQRVFVDFCPKVDIKIFNLLKKLKEKLINNEILKQKLFRVEFLSSYHEVLITLIYHKKLDFLWQQEAEKLNLDAKIIGRSKGVKISIHESFIKQILNIKDKKYFYKISEGSFSQPNISVNEKMICWAKEKLKNTNLDDLLELYCGNGNFTIPLSFHFKKVLATEISKESIKLAKENTALNNVKNITFVRLSSLELKEALDGKREFFRLRDVDLNSYNFSCVFVDPPRAGLDNLNLDFIKNFNFIIYISCNPMSLKKDLEKLKLTHDIKDFVLFDQFPHTNHIESGVFLKRL